MSTFNLEDIIDRTYDSQRSIIVRYHKAGISDLTEAELKSVSLQEGERIFYLTQYKGIQIYVLDETTFTTTHTFEALVAMLSIAYCKKRGYKKAIFSSGGNLGVALAAYCQKAGIEALSFNPLVNVPFLDRRVFGDKVHLIAVRDAQRTRSMMLVVRERMRKALGFDPLIPRFAWRLEAFQFRGLFIIEFMMKRGIFFSTVAQTISAGFGPLGTFKTLAHYHNRKVIQKLPRFFGVQQETNCYVYQRWKRKKISSTASLIVPNLFDKNPNKTFGTYPAIANLLKITRGDLVTINDAEFDHHISNQVMDKLVKNDVTHSRQNGTFPARSGLMALAGVLKAIDQNIIQEGLVLVCMTDGTQKQTSPVVPEVVIEKKRDIERVINIFKKVQ